MATKSKCDKYDRAINYLKSHPDEIYDAWDDSLHKAHSPFAHCTPSGHMDFVAHGRCGCLTEIRGGTKVGWTPELTDEIRNDGRIPSSPQGITVDDLPVFAEWQRRLDKELRKKKAEVKTWHLPSGATGGVAAATHPTQGGHARIIPAIHVIFIHKAAEFAFAGQGVTQVEARELDLTGFEDFQLFREPLIEGTMVPIFQGA